MKSLLLLSTLFGYAMSTTYSSADQKLILDAHNEVRKKTREGAVDCIGGKCPSGNIPDLVWNADLANIASKYSDSCPINPLRHSSGTKFNGGAVGENLWMTTSKTYNVNSMVSGVKNGWGYNEAKIMSKSYVNKFVFGNWGHYSQVVWEKTTMVGCGYKVCGGGTVMTCNYSPAGNYIGAKIYTLGGSPVAQPTTKAPTPSPPTNPPVVKPTSPGSCADKNSYCPNWAKLGYCTHSYVAFMTVNCAKTCGKCNRECVDLNTYCPNWKKSGYCASSSQYYLWMNSNCYKTCTGCASSAHASALLPDLQSPQGVNISINLSQTQLYTLLTIFMLSSLVCFVSLAGYCAMKAGFFKKSKKLQYNVTPVEYADTTTDESD